MSKPKYISIPCLNEQGGHIEASIQEEGPVIVHVKLGREVVSQVFDREEFMEWVQVVGTALRN